jgi:hypothetical protein
MPVEQMSRGKDRMGGKGIVLLFPPAVPSVLFAVSPASRQQPDWRARMFPWKRNVYGKT